MEFSRRAPETGRIRSPLRRLCRTSLTLSLLAAGLVAGLAKAEPAGEIEGVFRQEIRRLTSLLDSPRSELRLEGVRGLAFLGHFSAENPILPLLEDPDAQVRRETVYALGKIGGPASVPRLIEALDDPSWDVGELTASVLPRMTAQDFGKEPDSWREWWKGSDLSAKSAVLLQEIRKPASEKSSAAWAALPHLATPELEQKVLGLGHEPPPGMRMEWRPLLRTLERIGTAHSVPGLIFGAEKGNEDAAWALGQIGGERAEQALLKGFAATRGLSRAFLFNLDRLHSTGCGPHLPHLVTAFGLVSYRSYPDDLDDPPTPTQRAAANLILRSGRAPMLVDALLAELEGTPRKLNPQLQAKLEAMRPELKPGFVRADGFAQSMPLGALPHIARDPALVPRLIPLLKHPAFVARIYVATALGRLGAKEAIPEMLRIIDEGYPFSDSTALASGKHFKQSQTVRWRGYFAMALGWMDCEEARSALERLASDSGRARDIRYGAVVGLERLRSPKSIEILRKVADEDLIRAIRERAGNAVKQIERETTES